MVYADKPYSFLRLVQRRQQRRIVRAAVERAYSAFERSYPQWTKSLFDRYFIGRTVLLWLTAPQPSHITLTPHTVAAAWAAEVCAQPRRQEELLVGCLPVASAFLELLHKELATTQTVLPIFVHNAEQQLAQNINMPEQEVHYV